MFPCALKAHAVIGWSSCSDVFSLVRASLSQKLKRPSEPTVDSVLCTGWNAMLFTCAHRVHRERRDANTDPNRRIAESLSVKTTLRY